MPYVLTNPDDEDQKKNGANISGTDATGDVGAGAGGSFLSPQQSGTSGWTDVKAYLDANKDQANSTAQNIGGKLSGEADTLQNTIGQGEKDFEKSVDQNKVGYDQGTVDAALADPAGFVKDNANVDKFTKMRDASYGGPSSLFDTNQYGDLKSKIDAGVARGKLADTEGGREQLLYETGQNPTKGQVTLDSLLISGSPETRDILKQGSAKFGTLQSFLDEQNAAAGTYAGNAKTDTAATSDKTKAAINGAIPQFEGDVDARLAEARNTAAQRSAAAKGTLSNVRRQNDPRDPQALSDLGITDADLNKIGDGRAVLDAYGNLVDPITGKPYYSGQFDPTQFVTERNPQNEITRSNFASDVDYAKAAALGKLSGQDLSGFLNPSDSANAGKANLDTIDYDNTGAQGSLASIIRDRDAYLLKSRLNLDINHPNLTNGTSAIGNDLLNGNIPFNPTPLEKMQIDALIRQGLLKGRSFYRAF